jgi:hypothetical protein
MDRVDAARQLQRGLNCFSRGVNTSCRTETSAYTALHLPTDNATGGTDDGTRRGWVSFSLSYDMHGIHFVMEFTLVWTLLL